MVDRSVEERQSEAIQRFGETISPAVVGFVLSDGSCLDFGEGQDISRSLDHHVVEQLLSDEERAPEGFLGERSENLALWMDLTHAMRVSVFEDHTVRWYPPTRHVHVHLPRDKAAARACVSSEVALRALLKLAGQHGDFDLVDEEHNHHNLQYPHGHTALREMFGAIRARLG